MKKFINTTSIITAFVIGLLDLSVISLLILSINQIVKQSNSRGWLFIILLIFALFVAIKVTVEQFKNGVEFKENHCDFNGLDSDNTFIYSEIEKVSFEKDEKISFMKNFADRSGYINLEMKNGKIHVINLGTISKKKLVEIKNQIEMRM